MGVEHPDCQNDRVAPVFVALYNKSDSKSVAGLARTPAEAPCGADSLDSEWVVVTNKRPKMTVTWNDQEHTPRLKGNLKGTRKVPRDQGPKRKDPSVPPSDCGVSGYDYDRVKGTIK